MRSLLAFVVMVQSFVGAAAATPPASCVANTISLAIKWPSEPDADLYAVQLALSDGAAPFLSQTSTSPAIRIVDLNPDTSFILTLRHRASGNWSAFTELARCATKPLNEDQAWVKPPQTPPTATSVFVSLAASTGLQSSHSLSIIEYRRTSGPASWESMPPVQGFNATIGHLQPGTTYQIRARPIYEGRKGSVPRVGTWSDEIEQRTADTTTEALPIYRISERCGRSPDGVEHPDCQPDFLANHDTGDLLADVDFITQMSGGPGFVGEFNKR